MNELHLSSAGKPPRSRCLGRANGTNMSCIIIPCHRVIRADGTLCGYGGVLWRGKSRGDRTNQPATSVTQVQSVGSQQQLRFFFELQNYRFEVEPSVTVTVLLPETLRS